MNDEAQVEEKESRCFKFGLQGTLTLIGLNEWQITMISKIAFGSLKDPRKIVDLTPYLRRVIYDGGMTPFDDTTIEESSFQEVSLISKVSFESPFTNEALDDKLSEIPLLSFIQEDIENSTGIWSRKYNFWGTDLYLCQVEIQTFELELKDLAESRINAIDMSGYFSSLLHQYLLTSMTQSGSDQSKTAEDLSKSGASQYQPDLKVNSGKILKMVTDRDIASVRAFNPTLAQSLIEYFNKSFQAAPNVIVNHFAKEIMKYLS